MADIDRTKLAYAVAGKLNGLSGRQAKQIYPGVTPGLLSRVHNGIDVSAANLLLLCFYLKLEPLDFLVLDARNPKAKRESKRNHSVPVNVQRETSGIEGGTLT